MKNSKQLILPFPGLDFPTGDGNVKETGGVSGRGELKVGGSPKPPSEDTVRSAVEEGKMSGLLR